MIDNNDDDLAEITARTTAHYGRRVAAFWEGTKDHDVSQNREALLRHLEGSGPATILDLGCGPGRDLVAFTALGHTAVGLDATPEFCALARVNSGCTVLEQDFMDLQLEAGEFDGIFANASLFHVPRSELDEVLRRLRVALVPRGVLFCSNPRGDDSEGWNGERFGAYHSHACWTPRVEACGFQELEHYYRPPGKPRDQQPWLATVFRRAEL